MKDSTVLILFVLGIFLVFTVSGTITGNPIWGSQISSTKLKMDVLNMLNSCTIKGSNSINEDCNTICSKAGKRCIGGFSFVDNPDKKEGDKEMVITLPLSCSESPEYISYIKDQSGNVARLDSDLVACNCCSP